MSPSTIAGNRSASPPARIGALVVAGMLAGLHGLATAAPATDRLQEVCVGAQHSCARRGDAVACWGDNSGHQIAASVQPQFDTPRIVSEFPPAIALRCGTFETCVLTGQGAVHCLGGPPRAEGVALGQPARDVSLNERGGCALLRDGSVTCWARPGTDGAGPAGAIRTLRSVTGPSNATAFIPAPVTANVVCVSEGARPSLCFSMSGGAPVAMNDLPTGAAGTVMAGPWGTPLCAWFADGHVMCADRNVAGRGVGTLAVPPTLRVRGPLFPFDFGFCAREATATRTPTCFGYRSALLAGLPANVTALALGPDHACAITGGTIACWGAASHGQVAASGSYLHARPVRVPELSDAMDLDASTLQVCAVRRTGKGQCWGQSIDDMGRLTTDFVPRTVSLPPGTTAVRAPGPGRAPEGAAEPLCARQPTKAGKPATGPWRCASPGGWKATTFPDRTGPLAGAKVSRLSRDGRCGLDLQGRLVCAAPSATGTSPGRSRPVSVAAKQRFRDVASGLFDAGRAVVCGLTDGGRVTCFHVDDGAAAQPIVSPTLAALTGVTQLAAAGQGEDSVACALTAAGGVTCWGDGRFGQLGGATPASAFEAVTIGDLPPVAEIAVGGTFVCARTGAGEAFCWGSNRDGTAPDGATGTITVPVTVGVKWPQ